MLKYVDTKNAPAAIGPYSQGIVLNGIAFFSGQIPLSPETGEVVGTTIEEQAEQVMQNVKALLESQGAAFTDVGTGHAECKSASGKPGRSIYRRCENHLLPCGYGGLRRIQ